MPVSASMISANVFIDDFNRANGAVGSNYDTATAFTSLSVISNVVHGPTVVGTDLSLNSIKSSVTSFSPNQSAQVTYTAVNGFDFAGPAVRVNPNTGTGYVLHFDAFAAGGRVLSRVTGSVRTTIGTTALSPAIGDVFRLEASGNTFRVYRNNVLVATETDSTYSSGQPGLYYKRENSGGTRMDNFIAADIPTTNAKSLCIVSQTPVGKLIVGSQ